MKINFKDIANELYKEREEKIKQKDVEEADRINFSKQSIEKTLKKIYDNFYDDNNVFSRFPIDLYSKEIKQNFIKYVFHKIENSDSRQLIDNINRKLLNIGRKTNIQIKYKKLYSFNKEIDNKESINFQMYALEQNENRRELRYNQNDIAIQNVINNNLNKYKRIMFENGCLGVQGLQKESRIILSEVKSYINMVYDSWMQGVLYRVIVNKNILNREDIILELLVLQNNMIGRLKEVQNENCDKYKELKVDSKINDFLLDDVINKFDIFVMWLEQFDFNQEYISILDMLEDEMNNMPEKYKPVKKKYETTKHMRMLDKEKIKNIICEGEKVPDYYNKLEETKRAIGIFKNYGGRNVNTESIQDLKVFFREIYMDDNRYSKRAKKAMSIMRDYYADLDSNNIQVKKFDKNIEYIFIREKINRGFFREQDLSSIYKLKNKIQKSSMDLFLEVYKLYDEDAILDWGNRLSDILFSNLLRLLNEKAKMLK